MIAGLAAADTSGAFTSSSPPSGPAAPAILAAALNASRVVKPGDDQSRLLFWESTTGSVPDKSADLPAPWGGLAANVITAHGAFSAFNRIVWLFSRGSGTDGDGKTPVFASRVTGTGLGVGSALAGAAQAAKPNTRLASIAAILSLLVLAFSCYWCVSLGAGLARPLCSSANNVTCTPGTYTPSGEKQSETMPWRTGLQDKAARFAFIRTAGGPEPEPDITHQSPFWASTDRFSAVPAYLLTLASLLGLLAAAGLAANGRAAGALIDQRNRMSLTLTQAAAWGAAMFSALIAYSLLNIGYLAMSAASLGAAISIAFPHLESAAELFAIAGGAPLASKLTLHLTGTPQAGTQPTGAAGSTASTGSAPPSIPGNLDRNDSAAEASLWDIVLSEQTGQANVTDMNRVQTVAMTLVVFSVYLSTLLAALSALAPGNPYTGTALLPALPSLSPDFITILLASHGALLGGKWMTQKNADAQSG
jgi:hypothetical protein